MSYERRQSISRAISEASIEPTVSTLCVVDGVTVVDTTPFASALTPPARVVRGRQDEHLFFLFSPTDATTSHLCRGLREVATQTYWATSGSVTAALRRATSLANVFLFEHNRNAEPAHRCYGGLSCAVLRGNDLFLLQAGPAWACVLQEGRLRCFPRGERLAHMGIGPVVDVRLHHTLAAAGDTLLLASSALLQRTGREGLLDVLPRAEVESIKMGLEQLGAGADFTALMVRWVSAPIVQEPEAKAAPRAWPLEAPLSEPTVSAEENDVPEPTEREPATGQSAVGEYPDATEQPPIRQWTEPRRRPSIDLSGMVASALRPLGKGLGYVWHGIAAAAAGIAALGKWLVGAVGMTIRRTLPGPQREAYRQAHRRLPPKENRSAMIAAAAAIPILVTVVVTVAYLRLAAQSRFQGVIRQAEEQIALAKSAGAGSEEARAHWEQALQQIDLAAALQPDDSSTQIMREQARQALDRLDRIERLALSPLVDLGSSGAGRRLVLHGQMVFVLDASGGWGARVPLDGAGSEQVSEDDLVLVHTGLEVDGEDVGQLVDCAWVGPEGGRRAGALLVLDQDGGLLSYDPAWGSESGAPQLTRIALSAPPPGVPVAVGSYGGQFYVLAVTVEDMLQIWRYRPQGDAYPNQSERYFAMPQHRRREQVLDMAIDGHIYVLYVDGTVEKYLGGEPQDFEIRGVPGGLGQVVGFAVDPNGSGEIYIADPDNLRIVELGPDGHFKTQLRAGEAFEALEALAVNEAERQIYVLEGGRLHVASLP